MAMASKQEIKSGANAKNVLRPVSAKTAKAKPATGQRSTNASTLGSVIVAKENERYDYLMSECVDKLNSARQKIETLERQVEQLKAENCILQTETRKNATQDGCVNPENTKTLREENENLNEQLKQLKVNESVTKEPIAELKEKVKSLQKENEDLNTKVKDLEDEIEMIKRDNEGKVRELERHRKTAINAEKENSTRLQKKLIEVKEELHKAHTSQSQTEADATDRQNDALHKEKETHKKTTELLNKYKQELQTLHDTHKKTTELLNKNIQELQALHKQHQKMEEMLSDKIQELKSIQIEHQKDKERIAQLEGMHTTSDKEHQKTKDRIQQLEKHIEAYERKQQETRNTVKETDQKKSEKEHKESYTRLKELEQINKTNERTIADLQRKLSLKSGSESQQVHKLEEEVENLRQRSQLKYHVKQGASVGIGQPFDLSAHKSSDFEFDGAGSEVEASVFEGTVAIQTPNLHCGPCQQASVRKRSTARWYCKSCDDHLCQNCKLVHDAIKSAQHHEAVKVQELCGQCKRMGEKVKADWHCVDCPEFLCNGCKLSHNTFKPSANHRVIKYQ